MTISIKTIVDNKHKIRKENRLLDKKNRTTKAIRERNRKERAAERAKFSRMDTFAKCLEYRKDLDFEIKKAN